MKPYRRMFIVTLAALLGMTCLTACKNAEISFEGTLSAETFETQNAAVEAFLEEEIDGRYTHAELVEYQKEADLTADEIGALPLGGETVVRAERGTVSYRVNTEAATALTDKTDDIKTHPLYLLEADGKFRYFVPPTEIGQPITKSYFQSLFDPEKYANCTLARKETYTGSSLEGQWGGTDTSIIKVAGNVGWSKNETNGNETNSIDESYLVIRNGKFYGCDRAKLGVRWVIEEEGWLAAFANGSPLTMGYAPVVALLQDFAGDFSLLERTEYGLRVNQEKWVSLGGGLQESQKIKEFQFDYIVRNGRIEEITRIGIVEETDGSAVVDRRAELHVTIKDFGTTKVSLPADLKAELEKL